MENLTNKTSKNETRKGGECDICKKYFTRKRNVTRHKKIHNEDRSDEKEKNEGECDICKKYFKCKNNIPRHKRVVHEVNTEAKCIELLEINFT